MSQQLNSQTVETHSVDANDDLVRSVIVDQTDNLEKGWREAYQNSIDSTADEVRLDQDPTYTLIADDGDGVELTEQAGIDLLTTMGESSKSADDHNSIGEFGIGKGQIIAKGQTVFVSGTTALLFDIKNWGLEAKTLPLSDVLDFLKREDEAWADKYSEIVGAHLTNFTGFGVFVFHYPDEVPDESSYKWDRFESNLKNRFKYLESVRDTEIHFNGERISDEDPLFTPARTDAHTETYESDEAGTVYIAVGESNTGSLDVFSGGIYVTDVDSRGLDGVVVTERNLRLNFARNEIKSGCPVWSDIEERLNEIRSSVFTDQGGDELNEEARAFIADRIFNHGEEEQYESMEVFATATEDVVSLEDIKSRSEVGQAKKGNPAADKLEEAYGMIVLAENDPASSTLLERRASTEQDYDLPDNFDAPDRAEEYGLQTTYDKIAQSDLAPLQYRKLGVAKMIAEEMGWGYDIRYGESDIAAAWTDGAKHITITDSAAPSSSWVQWVPELWETLMHEAAHRNSSRDDVDHGLSFNRRFRNVIEKENGNEVLSKIMGEIQHSSLRKIAERGHDEYRSLY